MSGNGSVYTEFSNTPDKVLPLVLPTSTEMGPNQISMFSKLVNGGQKSRKNKNKKFRIMIGGDVVNLNSQSIMEPAKYQEMSVVTGGNSMRRKANNKQRIVIGGMIPLSPETVIDTNPLPSLTTNSAVISAGNTVYVTPVSTVIPTQMPLVESITSSVKSIFSGGKTKKRSGRKVKRVLNKSKRSKKNRRSMR